MARLTPRGSRVQVSEADEVIFREETNHGTSQLSGRAMKYGLNGNLYQPIRTLSTPLDDLRPLREQLVRYGLPVGVELELEVEIDSFLRDSNYEEQNEEFNKVVARSNRHIRNYLRANSISNGWESFRYAPMCTVKTDGSLGNAGREFVYAPMTPDFARASNAYSIFIETLMDYRWMGHHGPNTGGHMHIPLGAFSDQQLVLFYKLFETFADSRVYVEGHPTPETAARFLQIIGQRKLNRWARWYRLRDVATYHSDIVSENRQTLSRNRHYLVERSRHETMEHRWPNGTYSAERVIMRTSFLNAAYNFTYMVEQRSYSDPRAVEDIFDVDKFVQFVSSQDRWPELKRYLRRNYSGIAVVTDRARNTSVSEDIEAYNDLFVNSCEHAEGRV